MLALLFFQMTNICLEASLVFSIKMQCQKPSKDKLARVLKSEGLDADTAHQRQQNRTDNPRNSRAFLAN